MKAKFFPEAEDRNCPLGYVEYLHLAQAGWSVFPEHPARRWRYVPVQWSEWYFHHDARRLGVQIADWLDGWKDAPRDIPFWDDEIGGQP